MQVNFAQWLKSKNRRQKTKDEEATRIIFSIDRSKPGEELSNL